MSRSLNQREFLDEQRVYYRQRGLLQDTDPGLAGRIVEIVILLVGFSVCSAWLVGQFGGPTDAASLGGTFVGLAALIKVRRGLRRRR